MGLPRRSVLTTTRLRKAALWTTAGLVMSACGSTAQWNDTIAVGRPGDVAGDEFSLADPDSHTDGAGEDSRTSTPAGTAHNPATGSNADPRRRATASNRGSDRTVTTPPPGSSGRGFTGKEIYIGYATSKGAEKAFRGVGLSADFGDQEGIAKAVIKDINDQGGVAGRRIVPVFHDYPADSPYNPDGAVQAACTRWTEDKPVFAVVNVANLGDPTLSACLAQRKTPQVAMHFALRPKSMFSRLAPFLYAPSWTSMERHVPVWLRRAAANSYFGAWDALRGQPGSGKAKIGILSERHLYGVDFTRIVRQEANRLGQEVVANYEYSGDVSRAPDEMNQAVLQFRDAGVTHVVAQGILFVFAQAAESQRYRPRYAVSSIHVPNVFLKDLPRGQLVGAVGGGLAPSLDVDSKRDPGDVSPAQSRCRKIMQSAGQPTSNRASLALMVQVCDGFGFLKEAIENGALSPDGMLRGASSMGTMAPASTFRVSVTRDRFDGAAALRDLIYRENCSCFSYLNRKNHPM